MVIGSCQSWRKMSVSHSWLYIYMPLLSLLNHHLISINITPLWMSYCKNSFLPLSFPARSCCDQHPRPHSRLSRASEHWQDCSTQSWPVAVSNEILRCAINLLKYLRNNNIIIDFYYREKHFGIYTLRAKPNSSPSWELISSLFYDLP